MTLIVGSATKLNVESARIREFYSKHWARRIALVDSRFYDWQFRSTPQDAGIDNCTVALDPIKGEIAGVMGATARPFILGGRELRGAELTTWVVSEDYRGAGAGAKILGYLTDEYDALIGMGITAMALPIYLRSGFRFLSAIPRFVRVYNFDAIASMSQCTPLAAKLWRAWLERGVPVSYDVEELSAANLDSLFERVSGSFNLFTRDFEHIRWRYASHPVFRYETFLVRVKGRGDAFVALRIETAVPGVKIVHITDCIGDESAMPGAFAFIDHYCRSHGVDVADFYCTSGRINRWPLSYGWFSTLDDQFFQFPHLFQPVELRNPATTSLVYWTKKTECRDEMCDLSKLYLTKQDADFDRPTMWEIDRCR